MGFHGDHLDEFMHAIINYLLRTYSSIRTPPDRLEGAILEHTRSVCPQVDQIGPQVKKRKLKEKILRYRAEVLAYIYSSFCLVREHELFGLPTAFLAIQSDARK